MKKIIRLMAIFVLGVVVMVWALSQTLVQGQQQQKKKSAILTTSDGIGSYEWTKIISARAGSTDPESANAELLKTANSIGADYVLSVRFLSHAGYLFAYGTAVKVKQ
ncbi:MAG: hypothetical protein HYY56_02200 [Candidatus Omnitrophica bacterium]|nr:hypothetical protein [Candidatus Omnitrophota bacterium]